MTETCSRRFVCFSLFGIWEVSRNRDIYIVNHWSEEQVLILGQSNHLFVMSWENERERNVKVNEETEHRLAMKVEVKNIPIRWWRCCQRDVLLKKEWLWFCCWLGWWVFSSNVYPNVKTLLLCLSGFCSKKTMILFMISD